MVELQNDFSGCRDLLLQRLQKPALRPDAVRSQVIDALEAQEIKETGLLLRKHLAQAMRGWTSAITQNRPMVIT